MAERDFRYYLRKTIGKDNLGHLMLFLAVDATVCLAGMLTMLGLSAADYMPRPTLLGMLTITAPGGVWAGFLVLLIRELAQSQAVFHDNDFFRGWFWDRRTRHLCGHRLDGPAWPLSKHLDLWPPALAGAALHVGLLKYLWP